MFKLLALSNFNLTSFKSNLWFIKLSSSKCFVSFSINWVGKSVNESIDNNITFLIQVGYMEYIFQIDNNFLPKAHLLNNNKIL